MAEQQFAVSIIGRETTEKVPLSNLMDLIQEVIDNEERIEFSYDFDEFKSMYPRSI